MGVSRVWRALSPEAESDERFRQECRRLSLAGLKTLAAMEVAVPVLTFLAHAAVDPDPEGRGDSLRQTSALVAVGALTWLTTRFAWTRERARAMALLSAFAGAATLIWTSLLLGREYRGVHDLIPAGVTLIMLTLVAAVPLRPMQALALGGAIEAVYAASVIAADAGMVQGAHAGSHHVFIVMLSFLSAAVTAVLYERRRSDWESHLEALRVAEALTGAQLRAQLAENAVSIGKLAATLTHEINTPLGALKSSLDTLLVLAARQATAPPEQQRKLVEMQAALRRSIAASAERIEGVVDRLQRFISLGEAEVKPANLNDLVSDVALLLEDRIRDKVKLEFDLQPLPELSCRPQLLMAVFSNLLNNAIDAVNGGGHIVISTRLDDAMVEVRIRDNGRGMKPEEVENIFNPGFRVSEDRVASGNWSLFNIRQIVFEHGGDIRIESAEGKGTLVSVTIPR